VNAAVDAMSLKSSVRHKEPMASHTSWRVGGAADIYFEPDSVASLQEFLASLANDSPITWVGLGSNLLVRDGGIRGAVICTSRLPKVFKPLGNGRVQASAALPCATLAKRAAREGLGPAAFFAGIPGTVGGALAMNAGAFGGETWDNVVMVETVDRKGVIRERDKADFTIEYRSARGAPGEWFLGATFEFAKAPDTEPEKIRRLLRERAEKQPLGLPSAGSVFQNPPNEHAGELIERVGLKGLARGGAVVADKHANFIINTGTASAADIEGLIEDVRLRVKAATGIELKSEVRIIGEASR
jgi:UDP-N-acetylmuramate dehydrogenase